MEFSRQEYWSGLPFPFPGDLPNPGIKAVSLVSPAFTSGFFTTEPPWKSSGILFNLKKGGKMDKGYNMAEPWKYYAKLKRASHKRTNTVWLHLCEMSWIVKFIEIKSRIPGGPGTKNLPASARDGFDLWSGKIPHVAGQLSRWATTTEPGHLEPDSATGEATAMRSPCTQIESRPRSLQLGKALAQQWRPSTATHTRTQN